MGWAVPWLAGHLKPGEGWRDSPWRATAPRDLAGVVTVKKCLLPLRACSSSGVFKGVGGGKQVR